MNSNRLKEIHVAGAISQAPSDNTSLHRIYRKLYTELYSHANTATSSHYRFICSLCFGMKPIAATLKT